ncbi:DUF302 domain-containing protein [Pseudoalteromonas sp. Xi13]|uniref:DUF302 domain-containing protein n=1 Tax=Pseudoalteromonas sp. Xi13 TaxID=2490635 RepID=UPI000F751402|nr:DUF302 domain-containing protein [Pseudoalteromonas sp. Xi13]AZN32219.1 DUF302 domain-containing protein [Pseudoalteromonas sp. Xi13]
MLNRLFLGVILLLATCVVSANDSLVQFQSNYSVKETANRFEKIASSKGLTIFARVDHQKNAQNVNMKLAPSEVIIFGNPKVGTPLMQCQQSVAIDLPQKVHISQDNNGQVWLAYNNPTYLQERHNIKGCEEVLNKISTVLNKLSMATVAK